MVQPQKKPLLGLTADGLEVPAALCSFSQKLVGAVGREDAAQSPAQASERRKSPFWTRSGPWSCCELCELCVDKRTSRWDVAGVGVTECPGSVRRGGGKLPSGLEWRLRCTGEKE